MALLFGKLPSIADQPTWIYKGPTACHLCGSKKDFIHLICICQKLQLAQATLLNTFIDRGVRTCRAAIMKGLGPTDPKMNSKLLKLRKFHERALKLAA